MALGTGGTPFNSTAPTVVPKKKKTVPKKKNPPNAKPKVKKRKPARRPVDPYAPLDEAGVNQQASSMVNTALQPFEDQIGQAEREAKSRYDTRNLQNQQWYGNFQNQLDKSFGDTNAALNQLIALGNQGSAADTSTLQAALNAGQTGINQAAQGMGVEAPQGAQNDVLAAAIANAANQRNFQGASAMGMLAGAGERRGLAGTGQLEAGRMENAKFDTAQGEFKNQRQELANRRADAMQTALATVRENEMKKRAQSFQESLANRELGLKTRSQSFQENLATAELGLKNRAQAHQEKIDWANVSLSQEEIRSKSKDLDKAEKEAKTAEGKERAKLRGEQWNRGLTMLSDYLTVGEGEGPIGVEDQDGLAVKDKDGVPTGQFLQPYRRDFDDALRILTGKARMSTGDALRMLMASDFASWRSRARQELSKRKLSPSMKSLIAGGPKKGKSLKKKPPVPGLKK
jgi:hypothetical protein